MKNPFLKPLLILFTYTWSIGYLEADVIDDFIAKEVSRLNTKYETKASYRIREQGNNRSDPNGLIQFSRSEINAIKSKGIDETGERYLLKFIVAHEMAHQWQYHEYGNKVPLEPFAIRLRECQADILAAIDLAEEENLLDSKELNNTIEILSKLGSENNVNTDHPSGDERRLAFQYGILKGMLLAKEKNNSNKLDLKLIEALHRSLDWSNDQSIAEWSLKLSRRITHQDPAASAYFAIGTVQRSWNKNADTPFVSYSIPYTNISSRPLHVELQIMSVAVPRYSSSDISHWQRIDHINHEFDLPPGETQVVTGTLQWFGNSEWLARLIVPPEQNSLYAARFSDNQTTQEARSGSSAQELTADNLEKVIKRFLNNADQGYQESIAAHISEHFDIGDGQSNDVFLSALQFPGSASTEIWHIKNEPPYVRTQLYKGYSKEAALEKFDLYNNLLSEKFSRLEAPKTTIKSIIAESFFDLDPQSKTSEKPISSVRDRFSINIRQDSKNLYIVSGTLERREN